MKIIITMAGEGSRFKNIGFNVPKHEIIAKDKTLFEWSMLSLNDFFDEEFIFIVRRGKYSKRFIDENSKRLGITKYSIVEINYLTDGQASTVMTAKNLIAPSDAIIIYNIDTYIHENTILKSDIDQNFDGYVPSFYAEGDKWSFVKFDENKLISEVSEKVKISDYGTIGLYYFKSFELYTYVYEKYREDIISNYKEAYIAPMYKYLIDINKNIYASIIEKNKFSVLGTPDDIESFDFDYLQKQIDITPYKNKLLRSMDFNEVEKLFEENKSNFEIYQEYIIYLADTSQIDKLLEEIKNSSLINLVNSSIKTINEGVKILCNTVSIKNFDFNDDFFGTYSQFYYFLKNDLNSAYKMFKDYLNSNTYSAHHPFIFSYAINKFIDYKILRIDELKLFLKHIALSNSYNITRKGWIFKKIFSYTDELYPEFLEFKHKYGENLYLFKLISDICLDYPEAFSKYIELLNDRLKLEFSFDYKNEICTKVNKITNPKIAVAISGPLRLDYMEGLKLIYDRIVNIFDADVYCFTWENVQEYPGPGGPGASNNSIWAQKFIDSGLRNVPESIKIRSDFQKKLPKTAKKILSPTNEKIDIEKIKDAFPEIHIKFENEKEFEKKHSEEGYYRRGALNQAKMFYGIYQVHKMVEESEKEYDFIIRLRPDYPPRSKMGFGNSRNIDANIFNNYLPNSINTYYTANAIVTDVLYYGDYNTMMKFANIWEIMVAQKDLSNVFVNNIKMDVDSHLAFVCYSNLLGINFIPHNYLGHDYASFGKMIRFPNIQEDLEIDLLNIEDKSLHKEYIEFFNRLCKG